MALKLFENQRCSQVLGDIKSWRMIATRGQAACSALLSSMSKLRIAFGWSIPIVRLRLPANPSFSESLCSRLRLVRTTHSVSSRWGWKWCLGTLGSHGGCKCLKDTLVLPCWTVAPSLPPNFSLPCSFCLKYFLTVLSIYLLNKDPFAKDTAQLGLCGCPGKVYCLIGGS